MPSFSSNNDLKELKEKVYYEGKIVPLLESLECQNIHEEQNGNLIVAQLPERFNSSNRRAVQIHNNESLASSIRNRSVSGDIYSIVAYILYEATTFEEAKENLYNCKAYICNVLDYEFKTISHSYFMDDDDSDKVDWNSWLRPIKKKRKRVHVPTENVPKPESTLLNYLPYPHSKFVKDGISYDTQKEFEIGFDLSTDRITIPIRDAQGNLIGIKGRYAGSNEQIEEEVKYLYLVRLDKSVELYNLHRALPYIQQQGEVIVVEGAKTVMLLYQWGYKNVVSIEGKEITPVQISKLKNLGVDITFSFDKDVDMDFIKSHTRTIKSRRVNVIFDKDDLLTGKDSPTDKGKEVWDKLYNDYKFLLA